MTISRRKFIYGAGALALAPLTRLEPELILHNATIWTGNVRQPRAEATAISRGRFLAVGSNEDVLALASGAARKIDLGGRPVFPGFNDAHAHPCESGVELRRNVPCDKSDIAAIQAALRERAQKTPAGQWVLGFLYDDGKTPRPLNRADLDAVSGDHPVIVRHRGGHIAFVNSFALKLAGITDQTPDPPQGRFGKDAQGHLNGFVADSALDGFDKLIADKPTRDDCREAAKLVSKMFAGKGVTSTCDAVTLPEYLQGYEDARDAGELRFRVYCLISSDSLEKFMAAGIHTGFGDEQVRVGGVKQFADGSISERTAWLSAPYIGIPGDYHGLEREPREELYQIGRKAHAAGWQLATHANGDLAIDRILDVYEQIQRELPRRDPRFRIEHCTLPTEQAIGRMKSLGVIPVPFSGYVYFHGDVLHFYGEERARQMFPMRSYLDAGLGPPDSSDYTASPSDPMMWIYSQTTRRDMKGKEWGANQRISAEEALRCATINGAYASFEENIKGTIEPGKLADLVVLAEDPMKRDGEAILKISVERTMLGGKWVFES
jgi:predicted amidohydrolase YtcJ